MSANDGWLLIIGRDRSMMWASRCWRCRGAARRAQVPDAGRWLSGGSVGALTCTRVGAGVIVGLQWAVLSQTGLGRGVGGRAGVPAFLAGATVARLFAVAHATVARTVTGRRERERADGGSGTDG